MATVLCNISEIPDPGSKSFQLEDKGEILDIFVVHKNTGFYAFINRCPHTGVNLEWQEDRFLDIKEAVGFRGIEARERESEHKFSQFRGA